MVSGIVREKKKREVDRGNRADAGVPIVADNGTRPPVPSTGGSRSEGVYSNTPSKWHVGENEEDYEIVHHGVDTLVVGLDYEWSPMAHRRIIGELKEVQEAVRESGEKFLPVSLPGLGDVDFYPYRPKGRKGYQYHLSKDGAGIFLSDKPGGERTGNALIQYGAAYCNQGDLAARHKELAGSMLLLGGNKYRDWVSRIDIATDVLTPHRLDLHELCQNRVPVNSAAHVIENPDRSAGDSLYFGKRSSRLSACLYEKGRRVLSGENTFFRELWDIPEKDIERVVRLEYRFSRDWIREYTAKMSVSDVLDFVPDMFWHAWQRKRCVVPGTSRKRQADLHPLWVRLGCVGMDRRDRDGHPEKTFHRLTPATSKRADVDDLLSGPFLRVIEKMRLAFSLPPGTELHEVLNACVTRVDDSERLSALFGSKAASVPF